MWPKVSYEEHSWNRTDDALSIIPKGRRKKITATYQAAVPALISNERWEMPASLSERSSELRALIARFDQEQKMRAYNLPALMLRSESASSSQIEQLASSVRNVALAELSDKAPANARLIAGNVAAMRRALFMKGPVNVKTVEEIHSVLMQNRDVPEGIRQEQVWIGGTAYSPHEAIFIPPHASRVHEYLEDLFAFAGIDEIDPIAKAAIFHAQFETIHPFTDGNGRTGRTLLHRMLANDEILVHATLPVSSGLLHNAEAYMAALDDYHDGKVEPIVECLLDALEIAVVLEAKTAKRIDEVLERWNDVNTNRADATSWRLPALLVEQPVVNTAYIETSLGITDRAARNLVNTACERGILTKIGNAQRGAFYQASELISILEEISNAEDIRRMIVQ